MNKGEGRADERFQLLKRPNDEKAGRLIIQKPPQHPFPVVQKELCNLMSCVVVVMIVNVFVVIVKVVVVHVVNLLKAVIPVF